MQERQQPNYTFALTVVFIVCFLLGFVTTMNNSMIDFCKKTFDLTDTQGQLVNTAFYGAYVFSIPFALLMKKIGYKWTLVLGIAIIGIGFIINYAGITGAIGSNASNATIYAIFLGSMCCVALGIVMLQLVANPYVMVLGSPEKGAFRMTLSQGLNSVATTLAPIFITYFIIAGKDESSFTANDITGPFLGLGIFTLILCVVLYFLKLPNIQEEKQTNTEGEVHEYKSNVFKYPHVWFGALAIFMYMGVEIGIPSMLPAYIKHAQAEGLMDAAVAATSFLPFYWGGMMVGRFAGAAILSKFRPRVLLTICIIGGAACVGASFLLPPHIGIYSMLAAGLFHSVMWPLIFNLGLQELGPHTKSASGLINMGVIGAAILTPIMGRVVDNPSLGVGVAICMMFIYYAYILWFELLGSRIGITKKN